MKNAQTFSTAAGGSSDIIDQTTGQAGRAPHSPPAVLPHAAGRGRSRSRHVFGLPLVPWCLLALLVLLPVAGCSDSDSDDLVLSDALWVAFQDGDGPWQKLDITEDTLSFTPDVTDPDGRYGLAVVMAQGESRTVQALTLKTTVDEFPAIDLASLFSQVDVPLKITLVKESVGEGGHVEFEAGDEDTSWYWDWDDSNIVTLEPYTAPYDLVATLHTGGLPSKLLVKTFPDDLMEGDTWEVTVDFDDEDALDIQGPYTIDLDGTLMDDGEVFLVTKNNTHASLGYFYSFSDSDPASSFEYYAPASLPEGCVYLLELELELDVDSSLIYYEGFSAPESKTIEGIDSYDDFVVEFAADTSTGSLLPGMTWEGAFENALAFARVFKGTARNIDYTAVSLVTAGRVDADITGFTMPDLRSAQGWYPLWSVPASAQESYSLAAVVLASEDVALADFLQSDLATLYFDRGLRLEAGSWLAAVARYHLAEESPDNL